MQSTSSGASSGTASAGSAGGTTGKPTGSSGEFTSSLSFKTVSSPSEFPKTTDSSPETDKTSKDSTATATKPADDTAAEPSATETATEDESQPTETASSPSSDDPFIDKLLKAHNDFRATHHAEPLTWDEELARFAADWVNGCVFEHSGGPVLAGNGPIDPNADYDPTGGVEGWNNEEKDYTYNPSSGFSMGTGHFTQVVWAESKLLGCAMKACQGFLSSGSEYGAIMACEYKPAGNMGGAYEQNVLAP
ncbi:hypothetical protein JCM6882_004443 [Rhodosporidiobolus microsporus]